MEQSFSQKNWQWPHFKSATLQAHSSLVGEPETLRPLAEAGEARAQCALGFALLERQPEEGLEWLRKAEAQDFPLALWLLGNFRLFGFGMRDQTLEALKTFQKLESLDPLAADLRLAWFELNGIGIAKNPEAAFQRLLRLHEATQPGASEALREDAASLHSLAASALGQFWLNHPQKAEHGKAFPFFQEAAECGSLFALHHLGCCFADGIGTSKDPVRSLECFREASERNFRLSWPFFAQALFEEKHPIRGTYWLLRSGFWGWFLLPFLWLQLLLRLVVGCCCVLTLVLLAILPFALWWDASRPMPERSAELALQFPEPIRFSGTQANGQPFRSEDAHGRLLLLEFSDPDWPPSQQTRNRLRLTFRKFHDASLEIVSIVKDSDSQTKDRVQKDRTGKDQTEKGQAGKDQTETGQTEKGRTEKGRTGKDQTGKDQTGKDQTGKDRTGKDRTGKDQTEKDQTGKGRTGKDQTGKDRTGKDRTGKDQTEKDQTRKGRTGKGQTGKGQTGKDQTGKGQTGKDQTETDQTGKKTPLWPQLPASTVQLEGSREPGSLAEYLGVDPRRTLVLLDSEGRILLRDVSCRDLDRFLRETQNKNKKQSNINH